MFNLNLKLAAVAIGAILFMASAPVKGDIIAWSGDNCNGGEGGDVACDGTCFDFTGRHSFEVLTAQGHCVEIFEDKSCSQRVASFGNEAGGFCQNVNTGTTVLSFRCNPGSTC